MMPGQAQSFWVKNHEVVWVGKGSILKVRELFQSRGRQLHMTAIKTGRTPFSIGKNLYEVHVLKKKIYQSYTYLQNHVSKFKLQGLQVQVDSKSIVLGGEL